MGGPGISSEVGLDVPRLDALAKELFDKGLAPSTTRTYASAKQRYLIFCHTYNIPPLPLSEIKLCRYVSYLSAQQLKYQSIKCYLSAIRHLQISHGFADPFSPGAFPRLEYVLKGIRRSPTPTPTQQRLPITPDILRRMHSVWAEVANNPDTHLLWAACCVAFFGFLRSGELTAPSQDSYDPQSTLLLSDIALDTHNNPTTLAVTLKQSKTDPFRLGVTLFMGRTGDIVCPVKALTSFLAVRPKGHGPLFTYQDGSYLTRARLVAALKEALSQLGVDHTRFNGHSFRIGAATTAAQKGIEDSTIQMLGRWQSAAYLRYVQTPRSQLIPVSARLVS